MQKESFYFPHDYNATQDPKIMLLLSKCGLAGVGMYWIIIEILHQQVESKITYEQYKQYILLYGKLYTKDKQMLSKIEQELITCGLFFIDDVCLTSKRVLLNKKERKNLSKIRSEAGKKGAKVRIEQANAKQKNILLSNKRKGKERKGNNISCSSKMSENDFNSFWSAYPKKKAKGVVLKKFMKLDNSLMVKIIPALEEDKKSPQWQNYQYIPYPLTWINQARWEDEIEVLVNKQKERNLSECEFNIYGEIIKQKND